VDRNPKAKSIRKFSVQGGDTESSVVKEAVASVSSICCDKMQRIVTNVPVKREAKTRHFF
jgi:hypothetical protein